MALSDRTCRFNLRISVSGRCPHCGRHYIQKVDNEIAECRHCGKLCKIEMNNSENFRMVLKEMYEKLQQIESHQEPRVTPVLDEEAADAPPEQPVSFEEELQALEKELTAEEDS